MIRDTTVLSGSIIYVTDQLYDISEQEADPYEQDPPTPTALLRPERRRLRHNYTPDSNNHHPQQPVNPDSSTSRQAEPQPQEVKHKRSPWIKGPRWAPPRYQPRPVRQYYQPLPDKRYFTTSAEEREERERGPEEARKYHNQKSGQVRSRPVFRMTERNINVVPPAVNIRTTGGNDVIRTDQNASVNIPSTIKGNQPIKETVTTTTVNTVNGRRVETVEVKHYDILESKDFAMDSPTIDGHGLNKSASVREKRPVTRGGRSDEPLGASTIRSTSFNRGDSNSGKEKVAVTTPRGSSFLRGDANVGRQKVEVVTPRGSSLPRGDSTVGKKKVEVVTPRGSSFLRSDSNVGKQKVEVVTPRGSNVGKQKVEVATPRGSSFLRSDSNVGKKKVEGMKPDVHTTRSSFHVNETSVSAPKVSKASIGVANNSVSVPNPDLHSGVSIVSGPNVGFPHVEAPSLLVGGKTGKEVHGVPHPNTGVNISTKDVAPSLHLNGPSKSGFGFHGPTSSVNIPNLNPGVHMSTQDVAFPNARAPSLLLDGPISTGGGFHGPSLSVNVPNLNAGAHMTTQDVAFPNARDGSNLARSSFRVPNASVNAVNPSLNTGVTVSRPDVAFPNTRAASIHLEGPNIKAPALHVDEPTVSGTGLKIPNPFVKIKKPDLSVLKPDLSGLKQDLSGLKQDQSMLKPNLSVLKPDIGFGTTNAGNVANPNLKSGVSVSRQKDDGPVFIDNNAVVNISNKDTHVNMSTNDVALPNVKGPSVNIDKPKVTGSGFNIPNPFAKIKKPDLSVLKPDLSGLKQNLSALKPDINLSKIEMPSLQTTNATGSVSAPGITIPKANIKSGSVNVPNANLNSLTITKPDINIPNPNITSPKIKAPNLDGIFTTPDINITKPNINTPNLKAPDLDGIFTAPKINISKPNISIPKIQTPNLDGVFTKPDINIPKPNISIPKPNITMPKLGGMFSTTDAQVDMPHASVGIPNANLTGVVDVSGSNIHIDQPQMNIAGKGNMPRINSTSKGVIDLEPITYRSTSGVYQPVTYRSTSQIPYISTPSLFPQQILEGQDIEFPVMSRAIKDYGMAMSHPSEIKNVGFPVHAIHKNKDLFEYQNAYDYDHTREYEGKQHNYKAINTNHTMTSFNGENVFAEINSTNNLPVPGMYSTEGSSYGLQRNGSVKVTDQQVNINRPILKTGGDVGGERTALIEPKSGGCFGGSFCCCLPRCCGRKRGSLDITDPSPKGSISKNETDAVAQKAILTQPRGRVDVITPKVTVPEIKAPVVNTQIFQTTDIHSKTPLVSVNVPTITKPVVTGSSSIDLPQVNTTSKRSVVVENVSKTVNLHGPNLDMHSADLDVHGPQLNLQGPKIKPVDIDIKAPHVDVHGPKVKPIDVSVNEPKGSGFNIPNPFAKISKPDFSALKPDLSMLKPDINFPKLEMPSLHTTDATGGSLHVDKPTMSGANVDLHGPNVKPGKIDLNVPSVNLKGPNLNLQGPNIKQVDVNIKGPQVDIQGPKVKPIDVNVNAPKVTGSGFNIPSPFAKIQKPDLSVLKPDINFPKLEMPSLHTTNATGGSLHVDKPSISGVDVDLRGPNVKPLKVDLTVPSVDLKGPNLNLQGPKIKPADIDLNGPYIDVSTPRIAPVDVNLKGPQVHLTESVLKVHTPKVKPIMVKEPSTVIQPTEYSSTHKVNPVPVEGDYIPIHLRMYNKGQKSQSSLLEETRTEVQLRRQKKPFDEHEEDRPKPTTSTTVPDPFVEIRSEHSKIRKRVKPERPQESVKYESSTNDLFEKDENEEKQPVPPPRSRWNGRKDMEAHQTYYPPSRLTSIQRSLLTPYNYNSGEDPLAMFQQPTTEYDTGSVYYHGAERGRTNTRQSSIYRPDPIYSNPPTYDEAPVDYWKPKPRSLSPVQRGGSVYPQRNSPGQGSGSVLHRGYTPESSSRSLSPRRYRTEGSSLMLPSIHRQGGADSVPTVRVPSTPVYETAPMGSGRLRVGYNGNYYVTHGDYDVSEFYQ